MIETSGKKDGQDIGVITYEVSTDGKTLTAKYSTFASTSARVRSAEVSLVTYSPIIFTSTRFFLRPSNSP